MPIDEAYALLIAEDREEFDRCAIMASHINVVYSLTAEAAGAVEAALVEQACRLLKIGVD